MRVEQNQQGQLLFPTIHAARDYLRRLRRIAVGNAAAVVREHGAMVTIGPGIYPPLELAPEDSGTASAPAAAAVTGTCEPDHDLGCSECLTT